MKNRFLLSLSVALLATSSLLGLNVSSAVAAPGSDRPTPHGINSTASPTPSASAPAQQTPQVKHATIASPQALNAVTNPTPVYRFYKNDGSHFFTNNEAEKDNIIATAPAYSYEGVAFYSFATQVPGTQPVYRFYNFLQGVHFYTISYDEYQTVLTNDSWTYRYEGVSYYAQPSQVANTTPVYRFYKFQQGVHFYTSNQNESTNLINTASSEYRYEGIAYYLPTQLTFSGSGNVATDSFVLPQGLSRFTTTYGGSDYFGVELDNYGDGSYADTIANQTGSATGSYADGEYEGRYVMQVTATAAWTITIEQPTVSAGLVADFSGSGNQATSLFTTYAGAKTFNYSYTGDANSYFGIYLLDGSGNYIDLVANQVGPGSGSTFEVTELSNYVLVVFATGPWTISVR